MNGKIYLHTFKNSTSNKVYIGKTKNSVEGRLRGHLRESKKPSAFQLAIKKYGKENIITITLEDNITDDNTLNEREIFYIDKYNSFKNGYNQTLGGDGGDTRSGMTNSAEHRQKSSDAQKGKPKKNKGMCGKYIKTDEHKSKLSKSVSNEFWMSNETETIKIKKEFEQEYMEKGYFRGRKHHNIGAKKGSVIISEEQKRKISETLKNKPKINCPYCEATGAEHTMKRWHFDNCKYK